MPEIKDKILLDLEIDLSDVNKSITSLESLTAANKKLREERKTLNIESQEEKKRIDEINKSIDKNTDLIKENSSSLEKNKLNVGNYKESIKQAAGEINIAGTNVGSLTSKFEILSKSPLLLVVTALGLAFAALTAYFKGSEEGQDKLAKVMAIGKVVMEQVLQVVEALGEALFKVIDFIGSVATSVINTLAPQVGAALDAAIKQGAAIADLQDKIDADENEFIVRRAETNKKVAELREKAITQEGDAKRKTIEEAINLEKSLSEAEANHSREKLKLIDLEIAATGAATEEQKKQRAEAQADVINSEAQGAESTIKFQKQLESLNDEFRKKQAEADQLARADKVIFNDDQNNLELAGLDTFHETQIAKIADFESRKVEIKRVYSAKEIEFKKIADQILADGLKKKADLEYGFIQTSIGGLGQLFAKNKSVSSVLTLLSTFFTAQKAFESQFIPVADITSPARGALAAGAAVVSGLAQVAAINGVQFARGGQVNTLGNGVRWGTVGGRSHSQGGTKYWGSDGNIVEFEKDEGFFVAKIDAHRDFINGMSSLNMRHGGMPWGGRAPSNRMYAQGGQVNIDQGFLQNSYQVEQLASLLNSTKTVLVYDDVEAKGLEKSERQSIAQVL